MLFFKKSAVIALTKKLQFLGLAITMLIVMQGAEVRNGLLCDWTMLSASFVAAHTANIQFEAEANRVPPVNLQGLSVTNSLYPVEKQGVDPKELHSFCS